MKVDFYGLSLLHVICYYLHVTNTNKSLENYVFTTFIAVLIISSLRMKKNIAPKYKCKKK